jgi:hypothetical protein
MNLFWSQPDRTLSCDKDKSRFEIAVDNIPAERIVLLNPGNTLVTKWQKNG